MRVAVPELAQHHQQIVEGVYICARFTCQVVDLTTWSVWHVRCFTSCTVWESRTIVVEFIRDVVVVLALLMSLFAVAYHATGEPDGVRTPAPVNSLVSSGKVTA